MAFNDSPKVDSNAERSEDSVLKCLQIFSKKNGFISHIVDGTNDYGTDINCQIVINKNVSPYLFPIQVKSKISFQEKKFQGKTFLSTQFKTSRLGYLIKHTPTRGLIVFYDEASDLLFYDFAFEIFNRIRILHEDNLWKEQENVTILIPKNNTLDHIEVKRIHIRLINYFENHDKLLNDFGGKYELPVIEDFNKRMQSPLEFLEENGELLFYYHMFPEILSLYEKLEKNSLKREKIAYLGAITYAEVGEIVEADYFFKLCDIFYEDLSNRHKATLNFQRFKFHFYSGKISRPELKDMLLKMKHSSEDFDDLIYLKINLLNLDLMDRIGQDGFDEEVINETQRIFDQVLNSNKDEASKHFQLISTADILSKSVNSILTNLLIETRIIESLNMNRRTPSRIKQLKKIISLNDKCHNYFRKSIDFASSVDNQMLLAHSHSALAMSFFGQCLAFFMAKINFDDEIYTKDLLCEILKSSLISYNIYNQHNLRPYEYTSITLSYEIHLLAKYWANFNLNSVAELSKIEKTIDSFRNDNFKKRFKSVVEKVYQRHIELDKIIPDESSKSHYSEEQIDLLAKSFVRSNGLPEDRIENVKREIRDGQNFRSKCKNPDFILTSDQKPYGEDAYILDRPKYTIFSKSNNLIVVEGYDMEILLQKIVY